MDSIINYLKSIFGGSLQIDYQKNYNAFPMYMMERYQFLFMKMPNDNRNYVLVKLIKKQDINISQIKKQLKQIYMYSDSIPIFVFESLRLSQRNALIKNDIPFVQPDHQIYIPTVMINLNQKEVIEKEYPEAFSIAAQVTYIYLLLNNVKETNAPRLANQIPYSKITFNRALAELVSRKLLYTEGNNTRKVYKTIDKKEFWEKGKKYLFNPVEKVYYTYQKPNHYDLFISGETALSRLGTSLNGSMIGFYACSAEEIKSMDKKLFIEKYNIETETYLTIEQFKYNPRFLSNSNYIDVISLYAQLKDSNDERTQIALDELLEEEWDD